MAKKKTSGKTATLPRRFEFDDGTSSKFWEATLSGTSVTVTFGRIGTDGQSRTTEFSDSTSAETDFEKRIRSKVSKGYVETGSQHQKTSPPKVRSPRKATGKKTTKKKVAKKHKKQVISKNTAKKSHRSSVSGQCVLTIDQQKKVRKLLKSKDAKNIELAIGLLQSTNASADDWSQSFRSTVISQLVNTWDCGVWNAVAAGLQSFSGIRTEFMELATKRYLKLSAPNQKSFIAYILSNVEPPLSPVVSALLSSPGHNKPTSRHPPPLTELSDAAAESIGSSKHTGTLSLHAVTELSDAAAESLSKYEGELSLSGLTSLSDAAAESLGKHKGRLSLGGLTKLSDAAAASLSKHTAIHSVGRGVLWLSGLTELSDAAAASLGKHKGGLALDGLTKLSDAAAASLSKHKGRTEMETTSLSRTNREYLLLRGLTELSDAAAASLGKHKGELDLDGLTKLSDAAAEGLSKHKGRLSLGGLTKLSDAAAESLSTHEGAAQGTCLLSFRDLTSLSDAAAESLSNHRGLRIMMARGKLPSSAVKILRQAGHE